MTLAKWKKTHRNECLREILIALPANSTVFTLVSFHIDACSVALESMLVVFFVILLLIVPIHPG
jgi:hypothetical protein